MIVINRRQHRRNRRDDVCHVAPPADAGFDDRNLAVGFAEIDEREQCHQLERRDVEPAGERLWLKFGQHRFDVCNDFGQTAWIAQRHRGGNPLCRVRDVRRRVETDAQSGGLQNGREKRRRRAFTFGSGNMNRLVRPIRMAESL